MVVGVGLALGGGGRYVVVDGGSEVCYITHGRLAAGGRAGAVGGNHTGNTAAINAAAIKACANSSGAVMFPTRSPAGAAPGPPAVAHNPHPQPPPRGPVHLQRCCCRTAELGQLRFARLSSK